jgi:hypothetical protein
MPYGAFSPAEDEVIITRYATAPISAIAAELDRLYPSIQGRMSRLRALGQLDVHDRCYGRPWSEEDKEYLQEHWGRKSDMAIAETLSRPVGALTNQAKRLGINRRQNVWTATNVANLFGVNIKTVVRWIDRGWIEGKKAPFGSGGQRGEYRAWSIDDESVETFVRRNGWAYDWRRMIEGEYLTRLARSIAKSDPWLTIDECAAALSLHRGTVSRWTKEGLPHRYRPKQSQRGPIQGIIVVERSELLAFAERHWREARRHRSEAARERCRRRSTPTPAKAA